MPPLILPALLAYALWTRHSAPPAPTWVDAPRVEMPAEAAKPCDLYTLPENPTEADLEIGYATRGAQVVACNAERKLAVQTHADEHTLEDRAAAAHEERTRPLWKKLLSLGN